MPTSKFGLKTNDCAKAPGWAAAAAITSRTSAAVPVVTTFPAAAERSCTSAAVPVVRQSLQQGGHCISAARCVGSAGWPAAPVLLVTGTMFIVWPRRANSKHPMTSSPLIHMRPQLIHGRPQTSRTWSFNTSWMVCGQVTKTSKGHLPPVNGRNLVGLHVCSSRLEAGGSECKDSLGKRLQTLHRLVPCSLGVRIVQQTGNNRSAGGGTCTATLRTAKPVEHRT